MLINLFKGSKLTKSRRTMRRSMYQLMEILLFLSNFVVILRGVISGNIVKS